jgi:hypothetical protein
MANDGDQVSVRDRARLLAAKLTERIATNVIKPPERPLTEHMLVIVSRWRADDESVVQGAIERGKKRAEGGGNTIASRAFFGLLRFLGFGHMEATGEGGVEVVKDETEENVWIITTMIGVMVEDVGALALTLMTIDEKARKLPSGVLSMLIGVKPGRAKLLDLKADIT